MTYSMSPTIPAFVAPMIPEAPTFDVDPMVVPLHPVRELVLNISSEQY